MPIRSKKSAKVVIDGRAVGPIRNGVSRSILLLAKGLAEQPRLHYEVTFLCRPGFSDVFSGFPALEMKTPYLDPRENLSIPAVLWRQKASLYHSPTHAGLLKCPCPHLITIHDLIPMRWGSPLEQIYFQGVVAPFAARARRILTVSQTVRAELDQFFSDPERRRLLKPRGEFPSIEVVPNAVDPYFVRSSVQGDEVLERFGLKRGMYFLCLTNDRLHKNAAAAVRAFQMAREQLELMGDWKMVVTTQGYREEPGVLAVGNLGDAETAALLRGARALIFPSLEEGFGLPPLEAGVTGVPVIVSDLPVHREILAPVGPGEVTFVDPHQPILWVGPILQAARGVLKPWEMSTRERMLQQYSVQKLGQNMDRIYSHVLSETS